MRSEYKVGDKLCSCTLLQYCGDGGYGEVWLAEDTIGTKVALKILRNKYSEKEVSGLKYYKDCNHPNLLKIRHVEISENLICYTMDAADDLNCGKGDYLPDTLAKRLEKYGRLDGKEISAMLNGLLAGLEELHSHGLVHRDIKPDNILWVNGRITLSDAGLVAPIGKHSLVGTPGFVSPRLLETGGAAGPSDDFFALSKVVYCALTGLAPGEYPTIPQEMTISLDPRINRALLAGCSQEIKSSAEFRKIIAGKAVPTPQKKPETKIVTVERVKTPLKLKIILVLLVLVLAAMFFVMKRSEFRGNDGRNHSQGGLASSVITEERSVQEKVVKVEVPERSIFSYPQLPHHEIERLRGHKTTAADVFRHFELYQAKYLPELLDHRIFSARLIIQEISDIQTVYYNKTEATQVSLLSLDLQHLRLTGEKEEKLLKNRQRYWREQPGKPEDIIRRMLTEDPVMQMATINMLLEKFCRHVVEIKEYENKYKQTVQQLIALQMELLGVNK